MKCEEREANQRKNFSVQFLECREIEKTDQSVQIANESLCFKNVVYQRNVPFFFFFPFLIIQQGLQDLISLTRDRTHAPCSGSVES